MTEYIDNLDLLGFDDVAAAPKVVPDGDYHIRVVDAKLENGKKGAYIGYGAIVQSGPDAGHRIWNGIYSLTQDNMWSFKRDMKAIGLADQQEGMTLKQAAEYFVEQANGGQVEVLARVGNRAKQVKNDAGEYVADPDGTRENTVKRLIGPVEF